MRPINFLTIFALCLALVLFSIENTEPAVIHLVKGIDVQAPLSIELILAMGLGAVLAWLFSLWNRFQRFLESRQALRQIRDRDNRIQSLEKDLEQYKAEIEEQHQLPPGRESMTATVETTEAMAKS